MKATAKLNFIHRALDGIDIYFVSNPKKVPRTVDCSFRVAGRRPELWDAQTGTIQPAPIWSVWEGRTIVNLTLEQAGSIFVVFREPTTVATTPVDRILKVTRSEDAVPQRKPKIEIRKAVYGDFSKPDGKKVDVTAKLAELREGWLPGRRSRQQPRRGSRLQRCQGIAGRLRYRRQGEVDRGCGESAVAVAFRRDARYAAGPAAFPPRRTAFSDRERGRPLYREHGLRREKDGARRGIAQAGGIDRILGSCFSAGPRRRPKATFDKLISWPDSKDKGIKYFSGTAVYRKTINIPAERFGENRSILLDLGSVKEIAEVRLNGQDLGILWKSPFRVDITKVAKTGDNDLEVRVTNLWPNRLIGDEQYPDDCQWDGIHSSNGRSGCRRASRGRSKSA